MLTFFFLKYIVLILLIQLYHFFLFYIPLRPEPPSLPSALPRLSSCPWVVHLSFFASPLPILLLPSPCLFCAYQLCFLFSVPLPPILPLPLPTDSPPWDLHFCDFWNRKSWCSYCQSPTRPNEQRQGLNRNGCFIQMICDLRRQWVCTLTDLLKFHFEMAFYKENKV